MFFSFFSLVHPPNPWPKKGKPPSPPPAVLPGYSHRRWTHQRIDLHGITCPSITSVQFFWSESEDFYTNTWCFFPNKPTKKMTRIRWKMSGYFWHIFSCNVTWMFLETSHQPFGAGKITNLSKFTIFYNTSEVGEHHILQSCTCR